MTIYKITAAMEKILPEGKNFRLVQEEELPGILNFLKNYLPDSIKVIYIELLRSLFIL